jgi:transposase-like protein
MLVASLLDRGYSLHEIAERLGHDPGTLLRFYARVHGQRRAGLADTAAALVTASADPKNSELSRIPAEAPVNRVRIPIQRMETSTA